MDGKHTLSGRSVLVTGASGFVGQRVCRALVGMNVQVTGVCRDAASARSLSPQIEWLSTEIGPDTNWGRVGLDRFDSVLHLAAHVHQPLASRRGVDGEALFFAVNTAGTERLARAAAGRVRRMVFVSSLHAMATLAEQRLTEESPCWPDSAYGQSKLEAERRLAVVAQDTGLEVSIVRPPAVYGPGLKGHLAPLIRLVEHGLPLPLASVGSQRSLIFVDNLVDALLECAVHPRAAGETYLVSDGQDVSLPELIREISAALGKTAWLAPFPVSMLRTGGKLLGQAKLVDRLLGSLSADIAKIHAQLGWRPPHSLAEGLKATVSRPEIRAAA